MVKRKSGKKSKAKKSKPVFRSIRYRLYPNSVKKVFFAKTFGCCRLLSNRMLEDKQKYYEETGKMLDCKVTDYEIRYPFMREVDSLALANSMLNLNMAYTNFFNGNAGYPQFKKKSGRQSYTTNCKEHVCKDGHISHTIEIVEDGIKLPKIGVVKAKIHRLPEEGWILKSATVILEPDGKYYISVLFDCGEKPSDEGLEETVNMNNAIGLDYKSDGLYMDSNGNIGSQHKYYRESEKKLAKEQRKLSRKVKKSNNYSKQKQRVAKVHSKISNQRKDTLHKLSTEIANRYDIVCVESLNMRNLANKGFHNGKATMDNGYGMFCNMLEYKQKDRKHIFIKVDKYYPSSQICSKCGDRHKIALSERIYKCDCGNIIDRDLNAAINIRNEGVRLILETDCLKAVA